jgi:hypothetical protein
MSEPVYTPNSHKYKEEQKQNNAAPTEKRVQTIVKDPARTRKNEVRKIADIFISEDVSNVKNYIFMDVLVPAIKKAIYDIVTNGIDMFLYGGTGKGKNSNTPGAKVSYRNYYEQKNNSNYRGSENVRSNTGFEYDDIEFQSRGEAEAALKQMHDTVTRYGMVTVADLYDMAGLSAPYTSQKYGWLSVNGVNVVRTRDGYVLKLPRAVPIDD